MQNRKRFGNVRFISEGSNIFAMLNTLRQKFTSTKVYTAERNIIMEALNSIYTKLLKGKEGMDSEAYWRVRAQYAARAKTRGSIQLLLRNMVSIPLFLGLVAMALFLWMRADKSFPKEVDGVKLWNLKEYEIPSSLQRDSIAVYNGEKMYISPSDFMYVFASLLKVWCMSPEIYYKVFKELLQIGGALCSYSPSYFLVYREYDYTGPAITDFLRRKGIQTWNVMHGDKYYSFGDSFIFFDKYFIWNEGYKTIAQDMYAKVSEYVVFKPARFLKSNGEGQGEYDIGLLWPATEIGRGNIDDLIQVITKLSSIYRVIIRPHPRYSVYSSEMFSLKRNSISFSDPKEEGIDVFLSKSQKIIGYASTVLIEAFEREHDVICLLDPRVKTVLEYHPYFNNDRIRKCNVTDLESLY